MAQLLGGAFKAGMHGGAPSWGQAGHWRSLWLSGCLWAGTYAAEMEQAFPVLFPGGGYLLTHCVWARSGFPSKKLLTCSYVFGASGELGSLFLSLMEVLYDYPVVYLMSVLALCPSLLRPSES